MPTPFEGMRPTERRDHAAWVVEAMRGRDGIDLIVPGSYEAHVRIHHRIYDGQRWATFAPEYLVRGVDAYEYVGSKLEYIDGDGNLDPEYVDALIPLLRKATTTPDRCHYGLWEGWGWLWPQSQAIAAATDDGQDVDAIERAVRDTHTAVSTFVSSCQVEPWWGGRDMILFDGPIDAVSSIGHADPIDNRIERQAPQWWWPDDRAWFVGTEIEDAWTYVAGDRALVGDILASDAWEAVAVDPTDRW